MMYLIALSLSLSLFFLSLSYEYAKMYSQNYNYQEKKEREILNNYSKKFCNFTSCTLNYNFFLYKIILNILL